MSVLSTERWRAASPYLDQALELSRDERLSWLAALRAGNIELADDVAGLLEEHDALSRRRFLDTMTDVSQTRMAPRTNGLVIHWAARYDLLAWLLTRGSERGFRERLLELAGLEPGQSILDIGCGTGTLAIAATRHVGPTGAVHGIDASPQMIARATRKAAKAGAPAVFQLAAAEQLPFPDARFDVVLSTLMLHHLPRKTREQCATEVRRVLKPGGRVLAVDFGKAQAKRGLLAHFHRHGHVTVEDIVSVLANADLTTIRSGPVGFRELHFVLAEVASDASPTRG